jgi:gp178
MIKKEELIAAYERVSIFAETVEIKSVIEKLKQLEDPETQVPQFVADWYENNKDDFEGALFRCINLIPSVYEDGDLSEFESWVIEGHTEPFKTLVNMHQFSYTVEEEKRYYVRFKGMESNDFNYLNFIKFQHAWVLSSLKIDKKFRTEHTRKELEEAGFGWVFDCPGIEIEEVG